MTRYLSLPEVQALIPVGKVVRWSSDSVVLGQKAYRLFYVLDARTDHYRRGHC